MEPSSPESLSPSPWGDQPSSWVKRFASLIPAGGAVLDLACGSGRHARFLASLGYAVEAVDQDREALAGLNDVPGVTTRHSDLEGGPWPYYGHAFDGVVVTNYLYRPMMPHLARTLAEGGVLIYETFMAGNERFGRPRDPSHLLRPGELLDLLGKRFAVVAFEQGEVASPRPAVVQRICVRRGGGFSLPECV
jgi:SAM-dependent methyltransferase